MPVHIQYLRFGMVGLTNAIVDLGVLNLLLAIHPTRKPVILLVDNTIAVTLAIVNSYLWNTRWTFSHEAKHTSGERALFIAQGLLNIITNNLVLLAAQALFQTRSGIWYILGSNAAKLIAMIIASSLSFVLLRTVVFRAQRHGHTPPASSADGSAPARQPETEREQRHGRSYEARSLKADGAYPHEPVPRQHIRRGSRQPHPPAHQARQAHLPPGDEPQPQQQTPRTPDARVRGASSH